MPVGGQELVRKTEFSVLMLAILFLIVVPSSLLTRLVKAPSGSFFLGSETMAEKIWSSSSLGHARVTVTVTSAMADTYADTTRSSVTVETNNHEITLHNGETGTIEDEATDSVWLYENSGTDHNGYHYYGISGNWEVAVLGGGGDGGGDGDGGGSGNVGIPVFLLGAIILGIAVTVTIVVIGVFLALRRRKPPSAGPPPPPPTTPPPPPP